jgi:voltage-gated potassium channel
MGIRRRLVLVAVTIFAVIMFGSIGYYLLYNGTHSFLDCMFMTVISVTSVGYGEIVPVTGNVFSQIFTMLLITFGMGVIMYGLSSLTAIMIEGDFSGLLRKKKMAKQIEQMNGHYIVCGGGETGFPLIQELIKNHEKVVLVEKDEDILLMRSAIDENLPYIRGDAAEEHVLIEAGIMRAAGIVICLPNDKENLYITMTARMLNSKIRIVCRTTDPKIEPKLKKAGADRVVSPNTIGALRMASEIIRPTVVDFLDQMLRSKRGTMRINQISIADGCYLDGKPIQSSGLKDRYNLLVLGAKTASGEIHFNPSPSAIMTKDMVLIVMGDVSQIEQAQLELGAPQDDGTIN